MLSEISSDCADVSRLSETSDDGQMTAAKIKKEGTQGKSEGQEIGLGDRLTNVQGLVFVEVRRRGRYNVIIILALEPRTTPKLLNGVRMNYLSDSDCFIEQRYPPFKQMKLRY